MKLTFQPDPDNVDAGMFLGVAWVVYRRVKNSKRPFVFFGFEDEAMSLYPTRDRAETARIQAAVLRGHEWSVGKVVWGWGHNGIEGDV